MLSEERVKHMTNMALFEKKESKNYMIAVKYSRKDYVSGSMAIGFVTVSILYAVAFLAVFSLVLAVTESKADTLVIVLLAVAGVALYLVALYVHLLSVKNKAIKKYAEGKKKLKKVINDMTILENMYEEEEQGLKPELAASWDEE